MDSVTENILSKNNIKPATDGRCGFFVKRKQRFCKMLPAKGDNYCAEHLCEDKEKVRYNCFLPTHTVQCWIGNSLDAPYNHITID